MKLSKHAIGGQIASSPSFSDSNGIWFSINQSKPKQWVHRTQRIWSLDARHLSMSFVHHACAAPARCGSSTHRFAQQTSKQKTSSLFSKNCTSRGRSILLLCRYSSAYLALPSCTATKTNFLHLFSEQCWYTICGLQLQQCTRHHDAAVVQFTPTNVHSFGKRKCKLKCCPVTPCSSRLPQAGRWLPPSVRLAAHCMAPATRSWAGGSCVAGYS